MEITRDNYKKMEEQIREFKEKEATRIYKENLKIILDSINWDDIRISTDRDGSGYNLRLPAVEGIEFPKTSVYHEIDLPE